MTRTHDERETDRGWRRLVRENAYRDVWLILTTVFVVVALVQSQRAIDRQAEGRRVAVTAVCSAVSAVIDAGRVTIAAGANVQPPDFEHNLRELGLYPRPIRERRSSSAAQAYGRAIAQRVTADSGVPGIANPDGTLDCRRLRQVSNTGK